jgi:hypothetical protein
VRSYERFHVGRNEAHRAPEFDVRDQIVLDPVINGSHADLRLPAHVFLLPEIVVSVLRVILHKTTLTRVSLSIQPGQKTYHLSRGRFARIRLCVARNHGRGSGVGHVIQVDFVSSHTMLRHQH